MDKQSGLLNDINQMKTHTLKVLERIFASRTFALTGAFLLAFLLTGAQIMPMAMPFALAYAAARQGSTSAASYAGAFFGYVLVYGADGLCYSAAVLICYTAMVVFSNSKKIYSLLMPFCAALSLLIVKGAIVISHGIPAIAILLCESLLCGVCCYIFSHMHSKNQRALALGQILLLVALLLTVEPMRIFGIISPARAVCCLLVMAFSYYGGSAMGAGTGMAMGAAMDLSTFSSPLFSFTYSFSALLSGTLAGGGRMVFTLLYILCSAASVLWNYSDPRSISVLYECFIASVIFYLLPPTAFSPIINLVPKKVSTPRIETRENPAPTKLKGLSDAIHSLSATLYDWGSSLAVKNDENPARIYDVAADKICRKCSLSDQCWTQSYAQTCDALTSVTATLQGKRHVTASDFPPYFASKCVNMRSLCGIINEEYSSLLRRQAATKKNFTSRKIMQEQYDSISDVLTSIAISLDGEPEYYPTLEGRVKALASTYLKNPIASVYMHKGRMYVEISSPELEPDTPNIYPMIKSLSLALEKDFSAPEIVALQHGYMLRITQQEKYSVRVNIALRKCHDSEECGDSTAHFSTSDGRAIIMLSDGMGTGHDAALLSAKALELISQFVKSGCSIADSARAVLPVLAAQFEQCGFVTLDLLEVNLFTGRCQLLKYGAAPSFLLKNGVTQQFTSTALPAGLEQLLPASPQPILLKLNPGDCLIMVSDGICDSLDGINFGSSLTGCNERGEALTAKIMGYADDRKPADDMTALVIELCDFEQDFQ